jgi:hypothetical protein
MRSTTLSSVPTLCLPGRDDAAYGVASGQDDAAMVHLRRCGVEWVEIGAGIRYQDAAAGRASCGLRQC